MGCRILATKPIAILLALVRGDPAKSYLVDKIPEVVNTVDRDKNALIVKSQTPCIYQLIFADNKGDGPNATQWLTIITKMRNYLYWSSTNPAFAQLVTKIDCVKPPRPTSAQSHGSYRNYVQSDSDPKTPSRRGLHTSKPFATQSRIKSWLSPFQRDTQ
jgi:hypothetical protein